MSVQKRIKAGDVVVFSKQSDAYQFNVVKREGFNITVVPVSGGKEQQMDVDFVIEIIK